MTTNTHLHPKEDEMVYRMDAYPEQGYVAFSVRDGQWGDCITMFLTPREFMRLADHVQMYADDLARDGVSL